MVNNVVMEKVQKVWSFIRRNKFMITIGTFLLIIGVLDENSLIQRASHRAEIHQLKSEIERYREQYNRDSKLLKEISSNQEALEKVAREKYFMKKENEDIFVFENEFNQ